MIECQICGEEIDEDDDLMYECPICGEEDPEDGFFKCPGCDTLIDWDGEEWQCSYCGNEAFGNDEVSSDGGEYCPICGALMDDDYCEECGDPDVNQGWVGEHYG